MCHTKKNEQEEQALGRSRGGFTTKIHAVCDALGNPIRFCFTAGQRHDSIPADLLLDGFTTQAVLADKAYDCDSFIENLEKRNIVPVIPSRVNRKVQRTYDVHLYKERYKIECLFGFLKHYRRLFSRYDKLKSRFSAFLHFIASLIRLK